MQPKSILSALTEKIFKSKRILSALTEKITVKMSFSDYIFINKKKMWRGKYFAGKFVIID